MGNVGFDSLLSRFKNLKQDKPNNYFAQCPCHEDKKGSLRITIDGNRALIHCFAGCDIHDVLKAHDLTFNDLFIDANKPTDIFQYRDINGNLIYEKLKYKTTEGKTFRQRQLKDDSIVDNLDGVVRIPYNYPTIIKAIKKDDLILYVEGEKDADTGKILGYTATTMGSASDWKPEYSNFFKHANLVLIPDKDKAGINLTQKMIDDLKPVTKSLKVVVLPDGKDLSEWVEAGKSGLKELIDKSDDLTPFAGLPNPTIAKILNGYEFNWTNLNITVRIDRLNDDLEGIISIIDKGKKVIVHKSKVNLMATRTLAELSNRLAKYYKCDWNTILSQIAIECNNIVQFVGECENINAEPITMSVEYLLDPILPLNEPTTIFTSGGKGKSILADYFASLVQFGICGNNGLELVPRQTNVLYLDWEADKETHRRYITAIKNGEDLNNKDDIRYLRLDHPLSQVADGIRELIARYDIGLVIIDSQMAATANGTRGLTEAQVASEYYNILRSFGVTTLTIDHITKQGMNADNMSDAPYGSVVKYNRSRSQFELKLADEFDDADHKEYALVHKKFNLGRKQRPLGICVDFENTDNGNTLVKLTFSKCNIADNPQLSKTLTKTQRIIEYLKVTGKASIQEITEGIGESDARSIGVLLANKKKLFIKVETGIYGLLEYDLPLR